MDVRLIALDMDGTLLGADHETIPERNLRALREASARGVKIAIASGRCLALVKRHMETLGCVDYAVLANGACALDRQRQAWIFRTAMPPRQYREIIGLLRRRGACFEVYQRGRSYMEDKEARRPQVEGWLGGQFARVLLEDVVEVEDLCAFLGEDGVEKIHVIHISPQEREEVQRQAAQYGPIACANAAADNLEITLAGVDKGSALERLCAALGIGRENVMAFGDADNDLGMLSWAEWSFAMGNASPAARRAARYVTGDNDEGGVGMAVEKFLSGEGFPRC